MRILITNDDGIDAEGFGAGDVIGCGGNKQIFRWIGIG